MEFDNHNDEDFDFDNSEKGGAESDLSPEELEKLKKDLHEKPHIFVRRHEVCLPSPLRSGDKIAIISPASTVREEYVYGAMMRIEERGYEPVLMPSALGPAAGSYAADKTSRLVDLLDALEDNDIKAILCSRGGYGCAQLLRNFSYNPVASHPKWIIGFSDVSALLALWYFSDVASIHGPMAKHLATMPPNHPATNALFDILESGGKFNYTFPSTSPYNVPGEASGVLLGGNWAVLNDLAATPFDITDSNRAKADNVILFFEDISEPIYAVERMLMRLELSYSLQKVKGIIFGQFTNYKPDKNFNTMEEMLQHWMKIFYFFNNIPVVYNFPVGHVDLNYPLVVGAKVNLKVTETSVSLRTISDNK